MVGCTLAALVVAACADGGAGLDTGLSEADPSPAASAQPDAATSSSPDPATPPAPPSSSSPSPDPSPSPEPSPSPTRVPSPDSSEPPDWYRQRELDLTETGFPAPQDTPPEYEDRRIRTVDHLPPPPTDEYVASIQPLPDEIVPISTWREGCPTTLDELRYLTVSYWGFDGLHHTGELIVHRDVAEDMVWVFEQLHAARFPIEQVGLLDDEDFTEFHRKGDDNLTAAYQCRESTGSSRWSQHAYGRAIDINPFHNPYWKWTQRGEVVLPAYATTYLDREDLRPGMIVEGDVVVEAFDRIGWGWGGRWNSLKDWQHFSANGN